MGSRRNDQGVIISLPLLTDEFNVIIDFLFWPMVVTGTVPKLPKLPSLQQFPSLQWYFCNHNTRGLSTGVPKRGFLKVGGKLSFILKMEDGFLSVFAIKQRSKPICFVIGNSSLPFISKSGVFRLILASKTSSGRLAFPDMRRALYVSLHGPTLSVLSLPCALSAIVH